MAAFWGRTSLLYDYEYSVHQQQPFSLNHIMQDSIILRSFPHSSHKHQLVVGQTRNWNGHICTSQRNLISPPSGDISLYTYPAEFLCSNCLQNSIFFVTVIHFMHRNRHYEVDHEANVSSYYIMLGTSTFTLLIFQCFILNQQLLQMLYLFLWNTV